jgi:uncharacterized membrane protein
MISRQTSSVDVIKGAWGPFTDNLGVTVGVPAVMVFIPLILVVIPTCAVAFFVAGGVAFLDKPGWSFSLIPVVGTGVIAFALLYNALRASWTRMLLKISVGEPTKFGEMKDIGPYFVNFVLTNFCIGIATVIGAMFLFVPGVIIAIRTCLAPFLVIEEGLGPIEAMQRSNELVTGYSWDIFLYYVLYHVANIVCGFIPFIGAILPLATMGFFDLALANIYLMRKQPANA